MSKSGPIVLPYIKHNIDEGSSLSGPNPAYNMGANCWWNALLQCLFSCPAFIKTLEEVAVERKGDYGGVIAAALLDLMKKENAAGMNTPAALMTFAKVCNIKKLSLDLMSQEGTANGFIVLLDAINYLPLSLRFRNKYMKTIECTKCKKSVSKEEDRNVFITLYDHYNLKTQKDYEEYIIKHVSPLVDYKCESCGFLMLTAARVETLRMLREVMILVVNRGINAAGIGKSSFLPREITMPSVKDDILRWRYVGRIQHSGYVDPRSFASSGHYWADVCRFEDGIENWYNCNDSSIRKIWSIPAAVDDSKISCGTYNIDSNTHMIFYQML